MKKVIKDHVKEEVRLFNETKEFRLYVCDTGYGLYMLKRTRGEYWSWSSLVSSKTHMNGFYSNFISAMRATMSGAYEVYEFDTFMEMAEFLNDRAGKYSVKI